MNSLEQYFEYQPEPIKSTLLVLRNLILSHDNVTEKWLYGMPFYYYNGIRFCYLWVHKKYKQPYLGIVDGNKFNYPDLLKERRTRMKILLIDPKKDIPTKKITVLLKKVAKMYE